MISIVVAEDDKYLANAYRIKLQKAGFDVKIAADGQETLDMIDENIPDLLVLDLIMPIKDGFTVLKEIKKNPKFINLPIIIASNLSQKEDIDQCLALGANDYIVKSEMPLDDLVKKINLLLKN